MTGSTVRRIVSLLSLMTSLSIVATTNAATLTPATDTRYTVTDLGSNLNTTFTTQQDSSGAIHSVTSSDGSQTYAFEKSPVSATTTYSHPDEGYPSPTTVFSSGNMTIYSIGLPNDAYGNFVPYSVTGPLGWGTGIYPINDINPSGFAVGRLWGTTGAFVSYPGQLGDQQNLNDLISDAPGVQLSSAVMVDNLGDIIAVGTLNGEYRSFLLTPNGSPTPTPEPSTLAVWGIMGLAGAGMARKGRKRFA